MENNFRHRSSGFTLVELVMIMVIVGVLAVYAVGRYYTTAEVTGFSQAQRFARDLRHAQMLASTWGRQLVVTVAGANYSVGCAVAVAGTGPCTAATPVPVTDPATGTAFSVTLQDGAAFAGPATLSFDSMGRPSAAASYTLSGGGTWTIAVAQVTGLVTVSP